MQQYETKGSDDVSIVIIMITFALLFPYIPRSHLGLTHFDIVFFYELFFLIILGELSWHITHVASAEVTNNVISEHVVFSIPNHQEWICKNDDGVCKYSKHCCIKINYDQKEFILCLFEYIYKSCYISIAINLLYFVRKWIRILSMIKIHSSF